MKKNVLYTVTKGNRPAFMPKGNIFDEGGDTWGKLAKDFWGTKTWNRAVTTGTQNALVDAYKNSSGNNWFGISKAKNPFSKGNIGNTMKGLAPAIGETVGGLGKNLLSNGFSTGIGEGISSIGSTIGGVVGAVNPVAGGIVSAASGLLGGLWNGAFGVEYNEDVIKGIKDNAALMEEAGNALAQANTNAGVLDAARNMGSVIDIDYHDLGSTGFLRTNNALRREKARLDKRQNLASARQTQGLMMGATQADQTTDDLVAQDFTYSYGGPLNPYGGALGLMQNDNYINAINNRSAAIMKANPFNTPSNAFGEGGGIHIDPAKKGTFKAQATKMGMSVKEAARHIKAHPENYSPAMRRKAGFVNGIVKAEGGPLFAFGGELGTNGTDWTNGLLFVDGGGTHQQNPLGGVPVGFDQNGVPNLVEEGETIWNDYVFSNRIKVPKAMFHTLGLGGAMKKGITFADASKKLAKESEQRPNDPISMAGLDASLSKLAAVQEAERMKKQMRDYVGLGNMAAFGGPVNSYDYGGALNWLKEHYGKKYDEQQLDALAKYLSAQVSDKRTVRLNNGNEVQDAKSKSLLDQEYSNALNNVAGSSMFGYGKDKLDNLIAAGTSPDLAYSIVSKDLRQGSNRNRLHEYMASLPSTASTSREVEESANSVSPDSNYEWGIQAAEFEARRQAAEAAAKNQGANNPGLVSNQPGVNNYSGNNGSGYTGVSGTRNGINLGTWRTNDNHWDRYTRPGLEAYLGRLEERYNAAETPEEKRAIASEAMNEFNNLQQSYYQNIAPGIGATTSTRNNAVSEHQTLFNNMQGNYGFTNIADDINLPAGHSTGDVASQNWVDGYNGPRTWLRNFGSTEYGDNNYYQDLANRFSNMGLRYAPNQNWTYGNNTLYGLSMADETPASREPQIMSAEEEAAAKTSQAKEPSNYPIPGGGEANPGVDFNGRTYPNKDERPKLDTRLRYAPVLGSAISVLNDMFNTPDYTYPDKLEAAAYAAGNAPVINPQPIGDYLRYNPFDRMFYANQLQANARATDRALGNTASPSAAAGMLANAYNTNNSLGNLYRQAEEYNLAQRQQTADFNRRTNMFNSQMGLEAAMANARNRMTARGQKMSGLAQVAALRDAIDRQYSASRSANLTNFFNNLGNIGRENFIFNQINNDPSRSYGYNEPWTGVVGYWPKFMEDQYQKWYDEQEKKKASQVASATTGSTTATSGAYGGKLKRNKK